jgi:transposase-like protein
MTANIKLPRTLQGCIQYFSDEEICIQFVASLRWPDGHAPCPKCTSTNSIYMPNRRVWRCRDCQKQFSVKVGSIFEDSPIPLNKWLAGMWMIAGAKNGISSCELARALGVTQKSAWFMLHRLRLAIQQGSFEKMGGEGDTVEVDETYIGGRARNMHMDRRLKTFGHGARTGGAGKQAVFGLLERNTVTGRSKVRAHAVPERWLKPVNEIIKNSVKKGSNIYSDEHGAYSHLRDEGFYHAFVSHAEKYVDGAVHTNGIENFWALLKRMIRGTYVSVEPFHMFRYLDEEAFRFNERFGNDQDRFMAAMQGIVGRRVTYKQLTGKEGVCAPSVSDVASADADILPL